MGDKGSDLPGRHLVDSMLERALGCMGCGESGRTPGEAQEETKQKRWMRPPVILFQRPGSTSIRVVESTTMEIANVAARMKFESSDELERFFEPYKKAGKVPTVEPASPFFEAQRIIYKTVGASPKRQVKLAKEALSVYANCADAYTILAGFEDNPEKKRSLLERACEVGKAALEDEGIVIGEEQRDLWSVLPGRPYLRAKLALANFLYETGEKREALSLYEEILRLNPGDNQGVRHILIALYLELGVLEEVRKFLRERRDDFPSWDYAEAYLIYREKGDCPAARGALRRGFYKNPRIARYLLGEERLPEHLPESSAAGSDEEAQIISSLIMPYWRPTAAETSWTADTVDEETGLFPNPYSWLKDVIQETTAGLWPVEALDTRRMRERISAVWEKVIGNRRIKKDDLFLAGILERHSEFDPVFFLSTSPSHLRFVIDSMDPVGHVVAHCVVEDLLRREDLVGAELRKTLDVLRDAGLGTHEAIHLLVQVYLHEWTTRDSRNQPFSVESFLLKLRFVQNVAAGGFPRLLKSGPSRNDPCLCGSGRKLKKCCAREGSWPLDTLWILAEELKFGGGKLTSPGCPGLTVVLWEDSRYVDSMIELGQDHPILKTLNAFAVVERLADEGHLDEAALGAMRNLDRALAEGIPEIAVAVAFQAMATTRKDPSLAPVAEERAAEAVRQVQNTTLVELFWYTVAALRLARRDVKGAEQALEQGLSLGESLSPEFMARFMLQAARIKEQGGDLDEARERCLKVLALCDENRGREGFDAIRARAEQCLTQIEARLKEKATRSDEAWKGRP
ncbi:MAG: SEC-C domain-containing protein [Firmicutes bacterium]|nr:SEC-C domain-containing protein [Candidatus Fermentithermobacillaceae bacterium]